MIDALPDPLAELLELEVAYRHALAISAAADADAKAARKVAETAGLKVHAALGRLVDRKPLPLFEEVAP
jgi:predicted nucleic acid-binding protein